MSVNTGPIEEVGEIGQPGPSVPAKGSGRLSVRVNSGGHLGLSIGLFFLSLWMFRSGMDYFSLAALAVSVVMVPLFAAAERLEFDGKILRRRGPTAFLKRVWGRPLPEIAIAEIERVETSALRTLRRGGRVFYRYRTIVTGNGVTVGFASGGRGYREMVRALFDVLPETKLDARTEELRDFLADIVRLRRDAKGEGLVNTDDPGFEWYRSNSARRLNRSFVENHDTDPTRAGTLRAIGNRLRIAGMMPDAAEAFRRAIILGGATGPLLLDLARFLRSQAGASRDGALLHRSRAVLRLARRRIGKDARLLVRLGETFFEVGDLDEAKKSFERANTIDGPHFRSSVGLADIALRQGKLAHVIHNYNLASGASTDRALREFSKREAAYFSRLQADHEYLSAELARIGLLEKLERTRTLTMQMGVLSILVALVASVVDEWAAEIAWLVWFGSALLWLVAGEWCRMLRRRRPLPQAE